MSDRLTRLAWALLLGTAATGALAWVMGYYGPGYFSLLRVHFWVAWAMLVAGPLALAHHLVGTKSRALWPAAALVLGGVLAIPIPYALDMPEEEHDSGPLLYLIHAAQDLLAGDTSNLWPVIAGTALFFLLTVSVGVTLIGTVSRTRERDASRRTGLALTMTLAWATVGGALLAYEPLVTRVPGQLFHSFAGAFAIGLILLHLFAQRAARMRMPRPLVIGLGLVGVVLFLAGLGARSRASKMSTNLLFVETPRTQAERTASLTSDSGWRHAATRELVGFEDCASAGCHPDVTAQWAGSPHRFSADNAFYRAVTNELIEEGRWTDVVFCASCHDPVRVLAGTIAVDYKDGVPESGSDGVSCVVCHSITEVGGRFGESGFEAAGNGEFAISVEPPYPGDAGPERVANLRLDTRHHRDIFVFNDLIYRNDPCRACHRIDLGRLHDEASGIVVQEADMPDRHSGRFENYCRECHLPQDDELRIDYTHRMSGINADLARYATGLTAEDRELLADGQEETIFFAGLTRWLPIDDPEWGRGTLRPGIDRGITLTMRLRPQLQGRLLTLGVATSNLGVGHSFPSGPFDLNQVWLELHITDASGRLLHHVGDLAADGAIVGDALRLGARELNAQGEEIPRHRILDVRSVVDKRVIPREGKIEDSIRIELPEGVQFPLDARARWLFRRARPEFSRWALGRDGPAGLMPSWELARTHRSISE
jgi:uncharacterized protein (UPF0248 family)